MRWFFKQYRRFANRCVWSWQGFYHVWAHEPSLHQWVVANIISAGFVIYLPLDGTQSAILIMGGILVLAAECMNTAIERVVDDIGTDIRKAAKHAKDAASAAVALTAIAVGAAWTIILITIW